ncbi:MULTISPECIES: heptaprenyl diphosphate synthase component 1 [Bacillus]|uniref:heptaprenyl diphosphate synthase component 1 n=1 Tax=Bacillus TaxID=1386 RepID=UPI000BB98264|nr:MULTISPECIES: heptaprenyl diphosphate synthase component 1 [Bacillus]
MSNIQIHISNLKEQLHKQIAHPYLVQNIEFPVMDEDKLFMLHSILEPLPMSEEEKSKYIISTMLVQIALDTHDLVSNESTEEQLQTRQLTILAGDYYSGLYYHILAKLEDLSMIRTLAAAIKQINENKITYYQKDVDSVENLMECLSSIDSALIQSFSEYFSNSSWKELSSKILLLKRLVDERTRYVTTKTSFLMDVLRNISFPKAELDKKIGSIDQEKHLLSMLEQYIYHTSETIEKLLTKLPNNYEYMRSRIDEILFVLPLQTKKFVEEG